MDEENQLSGFEKILEEFGERDETRISFLIRSFLTSREQVNDGSNDNGKQDGAEDSEPEIGPPKAGLERLNVPGELLDLISRLQILLLEPPDLCRELTDPGSIGGVLAPGHPRSLTQPNPVQAGERDLALI